MSQKGGVLHWQAKLGMTFIGLGSIGLFLSSQNHITNEGVVPFVLMITSLLGLFMLMLSIGVSNTSPHLSSTHQLVPEDLVEAVDKIIGKEEE